MPVKPLNWVVPLAAAVLIACQTIPQSNVAIVDGEQVRQVRYRSGDARSLLAEAGIVVAAADQVLVKGYQVGTNQVLPSSGPLSIQIRRAVTITVNGKVSLSAAATVGEALAQGGTALYRADVIEPPADTPVVAGMAIRYVPSNSLTVTVDGRPVAVRSAANTVGAALADGGLGLTGLDTSEPAEAQPLPADGRIEVMHIGESLVLTHSSIAYKTSEQDSPDVELGQVQILQPGVTGLALMRTRIRYANGVEISRRAEPETVVRPPQDRLVVRGTKIVTKTATVNGVTFQYWRSLQMYATVYSPCESATGGGCSYGTASGLRAGKGVVAVDPALFAYLNGQRLYIPGYGYAVIGDVGGGYIVEQNLGISRYKWIDLGFDDGNLPDMTGWITVYFLSPAPANIPDVLK